MTAARPVVLLSYFAPRTLSTLVDAVARIGLDRRAAVAIGTYGANERTAEIVHSLHGAEYAPMFPIGESVFRRRRRLSPAEQREVPRDGRDGPIPPLARRASDDRIAWGVELGRRFRDGMRRGGPADRWQLDELPGDTARSRASRELAQGVLAGLRVGRRELGDPPLQGFVWAPLPALRVAQLPVDAELRRFWTELDRATFRLVGEEYPPFVGDPRRAARAAAAASGVLAGGPIRRSLAHRYAAGMTPGHYLGRGLGGNVARRPRREVVAWREAYVEERVRLGVAGLAEYNFRSANGAPATISDVLHALARVV